LRLQELLATAAHAKSNASPKGRWQAAKAMVHLQEQEKAIKLRRQMHYKQVHMETGKLSMAAKIAYGAPTMVGSAAPILVDMIGKLFYENLGMKVTMQATVMAVARSIDVLTDPSMVS
jgi:hypothetical protein